MTALLFFYQLFEEYLITRTLKTFRHTLCLCNLLVNQYITKLYKLLATLGPG